MNRQGFLSRDGFTLVETLIVLAIGGIVATMGFGLMLSARPHALLEQADIRLASVLTQARNIAVSQELNTKVAFDLDTNDFWIERQDRATEEWQTVGGTTALPEGIQFATEGITFPDSEVHFTPRGTLLTGGSISYMSSQSEETSTLQGNLATGRFVPVGGNLR
jgi:prepilin-type N-terminal cleavage/methylation domain-containing protein